MIADRNYAYDLSVPEYAPEYAPDKKDFKVLKNKKVQEGKAANVKHEPKSQLSLFLSVIAIFTMLIIVSFRYNLISEKNLELQRLRIEQTGVNSELATTEVTIDKIIDKEKVETYAKQQLGMQKPEKSQIVYVNSKYETKVENLSNKNFFEKCIEKIKNIINI